MNFTRNCIVYFLSYIQCLDVKPFPLLYRKKLPFPFHFFRIPDVGFNMEKKEGRPFNYFSFGAGISEVEVDCLTGDHTVNYTCLI